ncbi:MAG: hypothetical protein NT105_17400 [Verrucomicrobia bacterium]|nr:hypothetical protein [Verrucomicrobiota bacterium]
MENLLDFCGQKWKPMRQGELTLFLPKHPPTREGDTYFHASMQFVPPWLDEEDSESAFRMLYVDFHGELPDLRDWRAMAEVTLEARDEVVVLGEKVMAEMRPPEIQLWSHGMRGAGGIHEHTCAGWDTRLSFGAWEGDGYELPVELEAFYPSERARKAGIDLAVKEFFGEVGPEDWAKAELLNEGWRLSYRGRVRFDDVSCTVPINTADPVQWARNMARRDLAMTEFGFCRVNGGEWFTGAFKPEDGICGDGRLVLVHTPTEFFYRWQEEQRKKRKAS